MKTITFNEAAQLINSKPRALRKSLIEQGVFVRDKFSGHTSPKLKYIQQGFFKMELSNFTRGPVHRQYNKTQVTANGVEFLRTFVGNNTVAANDE